MVGSLLTGFVSQFVLLISGVLAARILGPQDRGYLALLFLVPLMLVQIAGLGIPLAATYYIAKFPVRARSIVRSLLGLSLVQLVLVISVQAGLLLAILHYDTRGLTLSAFLSLGYAITLFIQQFGLSVLQGQQRFLAFNILRVMPATLYSLGVLIIFVLGSGDLVIILFLAVVTSGAAGILTSLAALRGLLQGKDDEAPPPTDHETPAPSLAEMVRFGLKGFLGSVSPIDNLRLDQAAIGLMLNPVALGLYVAAQSFTNLPRFISQSIGMVAYPQVASTPDRTAARRAMWRYLAFSLVTCGLVVAILEVSAAWLVRIFFGAPFADAAGLTRILLVGTLFLSGRRVLADAARGANYPGAASIAEASSWISLLIGIAVLGPAFGAQGVALALSIAWMVSLVVLILRVAEIPVRALAVSWLLNTRNAVQGVAPLVAVIALCSGAGLAVVILPPAAPIGLSAAVLAALFFAHLRARMRRRSLVTRASSFFDSAPVRLEQSGVGDESAPDLRAARVLYYLGLLLICQLTFRPVVRFTVSDWLFFFSFVAASSVLVLQRPRVSIRIPASVLAGICIFTVGGLLSSFESGAPIHSFTVILRLVYITLVWFWLGTVVLQRVEHVRNAIILWLVSAAISGAGAIVQLVAGDVIPGGEVRWGRMTGFTENFNDLGGLTSVALVPAVMMVLILAKTPGRTLIAAIPLVLIAAGLLLSGSVGSVLAALVAAVLWFGSYPIRFQRLVVFGAIGVAVFVLYSTQSSTDPPSAIQRIVRFGTGSPDDPTLTLDERLGSYRVAVKRIADNPFVGTGLDLEGRTAGGSTVHNIVLGTWYATGVFGLIGIALVLIGGARTAWISTLATRSPDERALALALASALTAFLVFLMSEPALFTRYGWISVGLILALRAIQVRAQELSAEAPHMTASEISRTQSSGEPPRRWAVPEEGTT
jgi:O-antigen/teichoic acid export membrane protein/O-antigen ligase